MRPSGLHHSLRVLALVGSGGSMSRQGSGREAEGRPCCRTAGSGNRPVGAGIQSAVVEGSPAALVAPRTRVAVPKSAPAAAAVAAAGLRWQSHEVLGVEAEVGPVAGCYMGSRAGLRKPA